MLVQALVRVTGKVQGVNFRLSARRQAAIRGVTGWVRNRPDGSVEMVAQGEPEAVLALIAWCRQGPPGAWVEDVTTTWQECEGGLPGFEVRG